MSDVDDDHAADHPLLRLGKRPPPLKRCGTCGRAFVAGGGPTGDHIIPKRWLTEESRANLLKWRLCRDCNNDLGAREERLRTIFAKAESHHPGLHDEVAKAAERSPAATRFIARGWARTPAGLSVAVRWMAPELIDMKLVFRKLTQGLHWWEHHELPPKWNVEARVLDADTFAELTREVGGSTIRIGHEVWWRRSSLEDGDGQVWLFVLRRRRRRGLLRGGRSPGSPARPGGALRGPRLTRPDAPSLPLIGRPICSEARPPPRPRSCGTANTSGTTSAGGGPI